MANSKFTSFDNHSVPCCSSSGSQSMETDISHSLVKWKDFDRHLRHVLTVNLRTGMFADVTIICDGEYVKAHRMVLAASSPYFRKLFRERNTIHPIWIRNVGLKALKNVLQYMYIGEVVMTEKETEEFFEAARLLKVKVHLVEFSKFQKENENDEHKETGNAETQGPK